MLIVIVGESCVGKSTLAERLQALTAGEIYTGKDYLRLAKSETLAKKLFSDKLKDAVRGSHMIYVISEKEHLSLVPEGAVVVRMTADLELILERFTQRMKGNLPQPVRQMLERKHGCFDDLACTYHIHNSRQSEEVCQDIGNQLQKEKEGSACSGN